ncbi:RecX family transcriptional regulator [Candidatus Daviesbacteria bacterium]|nr:RecX family transcriptional regulator [Candidatus Daviesbacteria bacterium]
MPKITSVEAQKKNPHRFNIFLDGQFAFGADEDLVVEYRLISGKIIDQSLIEKLLFEAEIGKLMERVYVFFNKRARSEKEIKDYLKNLSFKRKIKKQEEISEAVVNLVIEKLKQKRLLNDKEFAKVWIEARSKKKGVQVIKSELYKKGIDREIIEEVINSQSSVIKQAEVAEQLVNKRLSRWQNLAYQESKKKAYEFLLRRGFDYEITKGVVENLLKKR